MEKRLPRKSDWEREHDILMSISDYPGVLSSLVAEYPENKQALDYLLCYYLLNENLNSFKNTFDTYYKGKFEVVPRLYEEALVQVLSKLGRGGGRLSDTSRCYRGLPRLHPL